MVYLVCLVYCVYFVCLVNLVYLVYLVYLVIEFIGFVGLISGAEVLDQSQNDRRCFLRLFEERGRHSEKGTGWFFPTRDRARIRSISGKGRGRSKFSGTCLANLCEPVLLGMTAATSNGTMTDS